MLRSPMAHVRHIENHQPSRNSSVVITENKGRHTAERGEEELT